MADFIAVPAIGEILQEEFMEPLNLSAYKPAQEIHVPVSRIQDIYSAWPKKNHSRYFPASC